MRGRRHLASGVVVALLCLAAVAPGAQAAPSWSAAGNFALPGGATPGATAIAYQSGGVATVAFIDVVSSSPLQTVLHAGVIPPGGSYEEQLQIPSTPTLVPLQLSLAVAPSGAAVLEWEALTGPDASTTPLTYLASYRAPGSGAWEAPATVATDTTASSSIAPAIVTAISSSGAAAAGVVHVDPTIPAPGGSRIDVAVHPAGGAWGQATELGPPGAAQSADGLALGFDAAGDLTAAYRLPAGAGHLLAVQQWVAATGSWGPVADLTPDDPTKDAGKPTLGVAPDGSALVAFQYASYGIQNVLHGIPSAAGAYAVARAGASGAWTTPVDIAPGGVASWPLAAAVSPADEAFVLYWLQSAGAGSGSGSGCVGVGAATVGAGFGAPRCVSATGSGTVAGAIAFLGNDAYFAWTLATAGPGSPQVIEGGRWLSGAAQPDSVTALDLPAQSLSFQQLVGDQDGSVAAFWTTGAPPVLRAAAFDGGGPNLVSTSIPTTALTGQTLTMSASFVDLWSGLVPGGPSWSFGDGTTGAGPSVSHAYAQPGTYTVTLSASDTLGNSTTTTYSVTVEPPPPVLALTRVGQSHGRWRESDPPGARGRREPPIGTSFRFWLTVPATVTLTFSHVFTGRLLNGRCVAATARTRKRPRCVVVRRVGTLTVTGRTGANTLRFDGQLAAGLRLAPGTYTVALRAHAGTAGTVSAPIRFTVVG